LVAGGGLVTITPGVRTASGGFTNATTPLSYVKSAGSSTTSLNVSGGPLTTVSTNSIVVGANVQLSGAQGIRMGTPMLNLGAGSSLASSLASGTAVSIGSQFPGGLTINLPDSGSVTMSTGGGSLFLGPALLEFPIGSPPGTAPTPVSNLP